jgi:hypothetical protein
MRFLLGIANLLGGRLKAAFSAATVVAIAAGER